MAEKMESKEIKCNASFAKQELTQICDEFGIDTSWVNKRQASKFRSKRGRIYNEYVTLRRAREFQGKN